jgi:hypothetical protein
MCGLAVLRFGKRKVFLRWQVLRVSGRRAGEGFSTLAGQKMDDGDGRRQ